MPTLHWIGKDAVVNHHKEVPFRLLKPIDRLSVPPSPRGRGDGGEVGNLLIQGDNLEALKALLPYYAGQVKCIYIDPPYNTGNEGWVYNDNVNSPEIKDWLGKVVGGEAEDLSRHDKWLCMMYPRLVLLREMLQENGAIFISIDDNEVHSLRYIMNEIFGAQNYIATVIWQKMDSPKNTAIHLSEDHDYIIIYAKNADVWRPNKLPRTEAMVARYKNPDNDPRGPWLLSDLAARNFYAQGRYPITTPKGRIIEGPPAGSYWRVSKDKFEELEKDNRIWWGKSGNNRPGIKRFLSEVQEGVVPQTLWFWKDVGSTRHSKQELSQVMAAGASQDLFITPKPTQLIERILQIATLPGDIVLDSFAGSGTTGHSVLQMNKREEEENRKFILIEIDKGIASSITAKRLRHVIEGYEWKDQKGNKKKEAGLGGGFRYCELGATLFDADGQIREEVKYNDLAGHVYFIETGQPLPIPPPFPNPRKAGAGGKEAKSQFPLLGVHNGTAVYLLYNGILKDKRANGGNVLTRKTIASLPKHDGPKVIYGTGCLLSEEKLRELGITFRQIPYEVKAS
ncbi:MAG: site-specific DNA-methyltransferase [Chloroflexi bacterium]|nr:site-specific DNA-methyltransferase [Chloroflexota bacterium]